MAYERLTDDLDIISGLVDEPNDTGGLSAEELKAKFDEAGNIIKHYINDIFLPEIEGQNGAENIGITGISQISQATNVQDALIMICNLISDISQGAVPDGSIGTAKLANAAVTAAKLAALAVETASIANGAVTAAKLAALAVGTASIINKAVTTEKIADGAVGTDQINNGAVTNIKLAEGAVQANNIYNGSVTGAKIASGAVSTVYTATLPLTGAWIVDETGEMAYKEVSVSGILASDDPILDVVLPLSEADAEKKLAQWSHIRKAVTYDGAVRFYAAELPFNAEPGASLTVKLLCIRK